MKEYVPFAAVVVCVYGTLLPMFVTIVFVNVTVVFAGARPVSFAPFTCSKILACQHPAGILNYAYTAISSFATIFIAYSAAACTSSFVIS